MALGAARGRVRMLHRVPRHLCFVYKPHDMRIEGEDAKTVDKEVESLLNSATRSPVGSSIEATDGTTGFLHFFNRLDYATSGVMGLALSREAAAAGTECFQNRRARKSYLAVVAGWTPPEWSSNGGTFADAPLGPQPGSNFLQIEGTPVRPGRSCLTRVIPLQHGQLTWQGQTHKVTKVLCFIHSGRRHQIRVHLASLGFPIVGDHTYAGRSAETAGRALCGYPRMALHAWRCVFQLRANTKAIRKYAARRRKRRGVCDGASYRASASGAADCDAKRPRDQTSQNHPKRAKVELRSTGRPATAIDFGFFEALSAGDTVESAPDSSASRHAKENTTLKKQGSVLEASIGIQTEDPFVGIQGRTQPPSGTMAATKPTLWGNLTAISTTVSPQIAPWLRWLSVKCSCNTLPHGGSHADPARPPPRDSQMLFPYSPWPKHLSHYASAGVLLFTLSEQGSPCVYLTLRKPGPQVKGRWLAPIRVASRRHAPKHKFKRARESTDFDAAELAATTWVAEESARAFWQRYLMRYEKDAFDTKPHREYVRTRIARRLRRCAPGVGCVHVSLADKNETVENETVKDEIVENETSISTINAPGHTLFVVFLPTTESVAVDSAVSSCGDSKASSATQRDGSQLSAQCGVWLDVCDDSVCADSRTGPKGSGGFRVSVKGRRLKLDNLIGNLIKNKKFAPFLRRIAAGARLKSLPWSPGLWAFADRSDAILSVQSDDPVLF